MSEPQTPTRIEDVRGALRRLSRRVRALVIARRALLVLAGLAGAAGAVALLDYLLRFPSWIRTFHLLIGFAALGVIFVRWVLPAIRFRPSTTRLALRIEDRSEALRGLLASGVEFSEQGDALAPEDAEGRAFSSALAKRVTEEAAHRWRLAKDAGVLRTTPALRALGVLALVLAGWATAGLVNANLVSIGLRRTVLPWTDASWPKRTLVADATETTVHPLGAALPLRAALLKSPRDPESTDVAARYRMVDGEQTRPSERVLLTWQQRQVSPGGARGGELFERLIEVEGDAVEVRFETSDDETEWRRIRLVEPPAVAGAEATITPPAYAAALSDPGQDAGGEVLDVAYRARTLSMGPGRDERAVAPRSLAGSYVELTLRLNKALEPTPDEPGWLTATLGPDAAEAGVEIEASADRTAWTLRWRLEDSVRLSVALVDSYGIASMEESVYRFEATEDRPPAVTIMEPPSDRTVLATAALEVIGEGRDDVGLARVWVQRQTVKPAGGPGREPSGPGGAVEVVGEPEVIAETEARGDRRLTAEASLDLSVLGLSPGDEVWLTALGADVYASEDATRGAERSTVRRLRIISEERFVEEVRAELSSIRQAAIRIDERQGELREQTNQRGATESVRRGQAQVSDRIARGREAVQQLRDRVQRNALADEALRGLLEDAGLTLEQAGRRSNAASELLDEAAQRGAAREEGSERAEQAQEREEGEASDAQCGGEGGERAQQGGASQRGGRQGERRGEADERAGERGERAEGEADREGEGGQTGRQGAEGQQGQPGQRGQEGRAGQQGQRGAQGQRGERPDREQAEGPEQAGDPEQEGEREAEEQREPIDDEGVRQAQRAQERVQEELESLIELLDRGEDAWVVRRRLDNILEEQRELQEATSEFARETTGEAVEDLPERQRTELERIAQRQRELANQSRELADELSERSRALQQSDPTASAGMAEAARTAQEGQVAEQQEQAGEAAEQNQLARAGQRQQEAVEQLERMQEDLERAERAREEVLSRILASLIESIQGLIREQEEQIAALEGAAEEGGPFVGLDEGMIRLNQNTLGVLDQASGAGSELAPVADLVGRASESQTRAIVALRGAPIDIERAREGETESLRLLREALAEAERIEAEVQQQMQDRKRRELRVKYRELLERQVAIRTETAPLGERKRLSRRERIEARRLGERQETVQNDLSAMRAETAELGDAAVFEYAHRRLDSLTGEASESLRTAEAGEAIPAQDGAVAVLQGLVEALAESRTNEEENPFGEGAGGQGSGGQQGQEGPLIPPLAELRLLRQLQADIARRTRGAEAGPEPARLERLGEEQRDLSDLGRDLIQRLQQQQQQGGAAPMRPRPQPEPDAPDGEGAGADAARGAAT